jgi:hypothetical protein
MSSSSWFVYVIRRVVRRVQGRPLRALDVVEPDGYLHALHRADHARGDAYGVRGLTVLGLCAGTGLLKLTAIAAMAFNG